MRRFLAGAISLIVGAMPARRKEPGAKAPGS
jgi:hypothetical protein